MPKRFAHCLIAKLSKPEVGCPSCAFTYRRAFHAAVGNCLLVMGGRTSEVGWFRSRTETYHNDVLTVDFSLGPHWRPQIAEGELPQPREFHTLSPVSGSRMLLLGGGRPPLLQSRQPWPWLNANEGQMAGHLSC